MLSARCKHWLLLGAGGLLIFASSTRAADQRQLDSQAQKVIDYLVNESAAMTRADGWVGKFNSSEIIGRVFTGSLPQCVATACLFGENLSAAKALSI